MAICRGSGCEATGACVPPMGFLSTPFPPGVKTRSRSTWGRAPWEPRVLQTFTLNCPGRDPGRWEVHGQPKAGVQPAPPPSPGSPLRTNLGEETMQNQPHTYAELKVTKNITFPTCTRLVWKQRFMKHAELHV